MKLHSIRSMAVKAIKNKEYNTARDLQNVVNTIYAPIQAKQSEKKAMEKELWEQIFFLNEKKIPILQELQKVEKIEVPKYRNTSHCIKCGKLLKEQFNGRIRYCLVHAEYRDR